MQKTLAIILIFSAPVVAFLAYQNLRDVPFFAAPQKTHIITFNDKTPLRVTALVGQAERTRGLSGRESLPSTEGMLFVFPNSDFHGIWMKEMRFPIDIIWVDDTGVVTDIAENIRPDTYPTVFQPTRRARFVIETNAYYANSFDIKAGDSVKIPNEILPGDLQK